MTMTTAPGPLPAFTDEYETLRAWVLAAAPPAARPLGLGLVLHRGLPAWFAAWPAWVPPPPAPGGATTPTSAAAGSPVSRHRTLAQVLATMVEYCRGEDEP